MYCWRIFVAQHKKSRTASVIGRSSWEVKTATPVCTFCCFVFLCVFCILLVLLQFQRWFLHFICRPSNGAARSAGVIIRNTDGMMMVLVVVGMMMMMMMKKLNKPFWRFLFFFCLILKTIHLNAAAALVLGSFLHIFLLLLLFFRHFFICFWFQNVTNVLFFLFFFFNLTPFWKNRRGNSPAARAKTLRKTVQSLGLLLSVWQKFHYCRRPLGLISTDAEHPFVLQANVIFFNISCREAYRRKTHDGELIKFGTFLILIIDLKGSRMEKGLGGDVCGGGLNSESFAHLNRVGRGRWLLLLLLLLLLRVQRKKLRSF